MSGKIQLPEHYRSRTVSSMGPDEIVHLPSYAFSADYMSRSVFVNGRYALSPVDHDQVDPNELDDNYYTQQKLEKYMGVMALFSDQGPTYVADLRTLDMNEVTWNELEETEGELDIVRYPHPGLDVVDYNQYTKYNGFYRPIAAAAINSVSGETEFKGEGMALDAVQYLTEEIDYLREALAHYIKENPPAYGYGYGSSGPSDYGPDTGTGDSPVVFEFDTFDDI